MALVHPRQGAAADVGDAGDAAAADVSDAGADVGDAAADVSEVIDAGDNSWS